MQTTAGSTRSRRTARLFQSAYRVSRLAAQLTAAARVAIEAWARDKTKLEEYLEALRTIEKQIQSAESGWVTDNAAKTVLDATAWQEAYDAAPQPSLDHVLGASTPSHPVASGP